MPMKKEGRKCQNGASHHQCAGFSFGESARIYAQWDRDTERQHSGYKNQLQRSRHPLGDQRERIHFIDIGLAEISLERIGNKRYVLLQDRSVEPQFLSNLLSNLRRSLGRDQHIDGIANEVGQNKYQNGHDEKCNYHLRQPLQEILEHGNTSFTAYTLLAGGRREDPLLPPPIDCSYARLEGEVPSQNMVIATGGVLNAGAHAEDIVLEEQGNVGGLVRAI